MESSGDPRHTVTGGSKRSEEQEEVGTKKAAKMEGLEEGPSTSGFQDDRMSEDEFGGSDRPTGDATTEVSGEKDGGEVDCGVGSNVEECETVDFRSEPTSQVECMRCLDLEKRLIETEKKLEETEKKLEETEKKLEESSKWVAEVKEIFSNCLSRNYCDAEDEDSWKAFIRSISSEESKEEEDIDKLVVKASEHWKTRNGDTILHVAAKTGNLKAVKHFLSLEGFKGNVNATNKYGSTPIMEAAKAKRNFAEIADVLVAKGADLTATNKDGETALYIALTSGVPVEEVEKVFGTLTSSIFSLTDEVKDEDTVLHKAAEQGNLKALDYFMTLKPSPNDVNARNGHNWTPIMKAISAPHNFSPIVDLLLKNGANFEPHSDLVNIIHVAIQYKRPLTYIMKLVEVGAPWDKKSILLYCIASGNVELLEYFIAMGADVNGTTGDGLSPVLIATLKNRSDLMDILIQNGAKPLGSLHMTYSFLSSLKRIFGYGMRLSGLFTLETLETLSKMGVTWDNWMIHECGEARNLEAVCYCVSKGADVNSVDPDGDTIFMQVVTNTEPSDLEIIDFLIEKGANVNAEDEEGFSVLHVAVENASRSARIRLEVIEKLLANGATLKTEVVGSEIWKETILHAAVNGRHAEVVEYVVSKGVDVQARDSNGNTPFLLAVRKHDWKPKILRALVDGGADPNDRDKRGNNALLIEIRKYSRRMEAVKLLVELGCDWRVPNKKGVTVLSKLEKEGDSEFLNYFKSLG